MIDGKRHYSISDEKLPVLRLSCKRHSLKRRKKIEEWKKEWVRSTRTGRDIFRCVELVCIRIEGYITRTAFRFTALGQEAGRMANVVIRSGLGDLEEVEEVTLYYPGLYAGQTDVVGIITDAKV